MNLEEAIVFLREGKGIARESQGDGSHLKCTLDEMGEIKFVKGSFYMTIYDILARDWYVDDVDEHE